MSRIGKLPISIPAGVTVTLKDGVVTVKEMCIRDRADSSVVTELLFKTCRY